jgi:H/ACA ribonucleoprotein complex subunit 4
MVELRRTRVGPLSEERGMVTLHQLNDATYRLRNGDEGLLRSLILPIEDSLGDIGKIVIRDSAVDAICHGARLGIPGVLSISEGVKKGDTIVLLSAKGELVAIGKALMPSNEMRGLRRGLVSTTERVVMKAGTYPRLWKSHSKGSAS